MTETSQEAGQRLAGEAEHPPTDHQLETIARILAAHLREKAKGKKNIEQKLLKPRPGVTRTKAAEK